MTPFLPHLAKWALVSAQDFADRFSDPFLRRAIPADVRLAGDPDDGRALPAGLHAHRQRRLPRRRLAGVRPRPRTPLPGAGRRRSTTSRRWRTSWSKNERAVGVRLYNDDDPPRRRASSPPPMAAARSSTCWAAVPDRKITRSRTTGTCRIHTLIQVSLGVNRDFSAEPHWVTHLLDEPVLIAGEEHTEIGVKHYCFDPSLAPAGKSAVIVDAAHQLRLLAAHLRPPASTTPSRTRWPDIVHRLPGDASIPGCARDIEVIDVATPLSYERYTGNWQGSSCGWLLTKQTMPLMIIGMPKTLPGLAELLPGRAVGGAGRQRPAGGHVGPQRHPADLRRGSKRSSSLKRPDGVTILGVAGMQLHVTMN